MVRLYYNTLTVACVGDVIPYFSGGKGDFLNVHKVFLSFKYIYSILSLHCAFSFKKWEEDFHFGSTVVRDNFKIQYFSGMLPFEFSLKSPSSQQGALCYRTYINLPGQHLISLCRLSIGNELLLMQVTKEKKKETLTPR